MPKVSRNTTTYTSPATLREPLSGLQKYHLRILRQYMTSQLNYKAVLSVTLLSLSGQYSYKKYRSLRSDDKLSSQLRV